MTLDIRAEKARGYVLIAILYLHLLVTYVLTRGDPASAPIAFVQIKLLAPHVSVFFFLTGMGARGLGRRSLSSVLTQSLMLLLLAALSHAIGYWIGPFLHDPPVGLRATARDFLTPLVTGTGYATFVAWFFEVFALSRLIAYTFECGWRWFVPTVAILSLILWAGQRAGMPDNWLEWRNLPACTLFFLIGMRIPREWRVPHWLGALCLPATLAIAWFNRPGILHDGPCLACNIPFVSQPMVGQYGSAPIFLLQEFSFLLFLLWASQLLPDKPFNRIPRFFGLHATQLLLLHGWVIAGLFPFLRPIFPAQEHLWIFPLMLVGAAAFHAALFLITRPLLDKVLALCFALARMIVNVGTRPFAPSVQAAR